MLPPSKSEDKPKEESNQMFYGVVIIIVLVVSAIIIYTLSLQSKNNKSGYTERYESDSPLKPDEYEREGGSFIYYPYL
jgi:hypothetical protein